MTDYPWDGRVRLRVENDIAEPVALNLRRPGWCASCTLRLNGQSVVPVPLNDDGYIAMRRTWKAGDTIELMLEMPVQRIEAHPNIRDCVGKVALQRGPIIFGFEALDNGGRLDLELGADPAFEAVRQPELLGGITAIKGKAVDGRPLLAIPFYALANRDKSAQEVWLKQRGLKPGGDWWESSLYRPLNPRQLRP